MQFDVYLLPQSAFPTGGLYFKNKTWVKETKAKHAIIHNNYVTGFEKKIKWFHDHGLWLVDDHSHESPLGRIWACSQGAEAHLSSRQATASQFCSCILTREASFCRTKHGKMFGPPRKMQHPKIKSLCRRYYLPIANLLFDLYVKPLQRFHFPWVDGDCCFNMNK